MVSRFFPYRLIPFVTGLLTLSAACGGPTSPNPPITDIKVTCPANVHVENVVGPSQSVHYPDVTATGGSPPIKTTCTPGSDSTFTVGTTPVTCDATDGIRSASCTFSVTLDPVPVIKATRFLAFGDSITAGENGEDGQSIVTQPSIIDVPNSYPTQLTMMLADRYKSQSPTVANAGVPRETAFDGANRIDGVIDRVHPQVLLLLEGVNDLTGNLPSDSNRILTALSRDLRSARDHLLVAAFLSTLIPQNPAGYRSHNANEIEPINAMIRDLAASQRAVLEDSYAAFGGHLEYLDADGLHPLPMGNQVIAQAFFAAIQAKLEAPPTQAITTLTSAGRHLLGLQPPAATRPPAAGTRAPAGADGRPTIKRSRR